MRVRDIILSIAIVLQILGATLIIVFAVNLFLIPALDSVYKNLRNTPCIQLPDFSDIQNREGKLLIVERVSENEFKLVWREKE